MTLKTTSDWLHSPNLVDFNSRDKIIITNWCGKDLKLVKPDYRNNLLPRIQKLCDNIYDKYGIYHNDIRWKNITVKNGNIILIDWGMSGELNRERDPEKILREDQRGSKMIDVVTCKI